MSREHKFFCEECRKEVHKDRISYHKIERENKSEKLRTTLLCPKCVEFRKSTIKLMRKFVF